LSDRLSVPETASAWRISRALLALVAVIFGLLLAIGLALWLHYGTAVFYEMIAAGIAACL
jgi:hypothetical protein